MNKDNGKEKQNPVQKLATFIVDKRKAFYLIYIGLAIFCLFSSGWVNVNNDLTDYLSEDTETRQGLTVMDEQFITFATADVMVDNISFEQAERLCAKVEKIEGVSSVDFSNTKEHYTGASAMFSVTFDGETTDEASIGAMNDIKSLLSDYDLYIDSEVGSDQAKQMASEINVVMIIAVVIILAVLLFTSHTYAEIPVLLITFGAAALLGKGTNFIFGTISFVSDSVTVVLQLALAIDYAIILCHRYTEERERLEPREAVITALSKAIPEIAGSSLTTLSGLAAMTFMHFRIGFDMGIVLIKAIILSLISVFTLMPGLLLSCSSLIDKSHHKSFVPKISGLGRFLVKTRLIIPPIFVVLLAAGFFLSNNCPYVFGTTTLDTVSKNDAQIAKQRISETFDTKNTLAVLVPTGDYETEGKLCKRLDAMPEIKSVTALANIEVLDEYTLTQELTPRQFAELTDLDIDVARLLYSAYAIDGESYGKLVSGVDNYGVPLIDMFMFMYDEIQAGYVTLDYDLNKTVEDLHSQLSDALLQLQGSDYSRIVLDLDLLEEGTETFAFLDALHETVGEYYPDGCLLVGNATSNSDLASTFGQDNILINVLSVVFVMLVLLFTFKSAGIPVLLIVVIQGSIWINFAFPYLESSNLFFMSYLIVQSIQMGANIDYAIVITNRYSELKQRMPIREAIVETLNQAFPTIITSGTILVSAGLLIGLLSSNPIISSIGMCLGRGTVISILLVMIVLPQILLLGDTLIEKTAFTIAKPAALHSLSGTVRIDGHIRGNISGYVDGEFNGILKGNMDAVVQTGALKETETEETESEVCDNEDK